MYDVNIRQDPDLLSSMDPAQIAAAVQHCPIPLDSALQVSGGSVSWDSPALLSYDQGGEVLQEGDPAFQPVFGQPLVTGHQIQVNITKLKIGEDSTGPKFFFNF